MSVFPDCNGNGASDVADLAANTSFDCDANRIPDECQAAPACIGAGSVPDGGVVPGTQLTVAKLPGGNIRLSWGASCRPGDDFAIYEGTLGSFASHTARFCTTGGQTTKTLTPAGGGAYYLVVPNHADREGSYGKDSAGNERPGGVTACFPQLIRPCSLLENDEASTVSENESRASIR